MTPAERKQEAFRLSDVEGLTQAEIAKRLRISTTTVNNYLNPEKDRERRQRQVASFKAPNPNAHRVTGPRTART